MLWLIFQIIELPVVDQVTVTHYAQWHEDSHSEAETKVILDSVADSQLQIANYLAAHPDSFVLVEGLLQPLTKIPADKAKAVQKTFPNGFPKNVKDLNDEQKVFLVKEGGAETAFYLGLVRELLPAVPEEVEKQTWTVIDALRAKHGWDLASAETNPTYLKWVMTEREAALGKSVRDLLPKAKALNKEIVLSFGGSHSLDYLFFDTSEIQFQRRETGEFSRYFPEAQKIEWQKFPWPLEHRLFYYARLVKRSSNSEDLQFARKQQQEILEHIKSKKLKIPAWSVYAMVDNDLKKQSLDFLDPKSYGKEFTFADLLKALPIEQAIEACSFLP